MHPTGVASRRPRFVLWYIFAIMSDCASPLHPRAAAGLRLFNSGRYWEAHEALEAAWNEERGEVRRLYKGLLQAAVVHLHITRSNYVGALKVYERSRRWLDPWPAVCRGVQVGRLREDLATAVDAVRLAMAAADAATTVPLQPIEWEDPGPQAARVYTCDRCGEQMNEHNCKVICPNCGNFFDCSDLTLKYD